MVVDSYAMVINIVDNEYNKGAFKKGVTIVRQK